jgi:hypothetical protein
MRHSFRERVLLVGAWIMAGTLAWGQQAPSLVKQAPVSIDLAVTFSPERAQIDTTNTPFWLQGGGVDAVATFRNGWGAAAAFNAEHAANVTPGVDVNKASFLAGPRYTFRINRAGNPLRRPLLIFGEALLGDAHAFNSVIPTMGTAVVSSADVFALQTGGGLDLALNKRFGVRLLQADYVRTTLPNNSSNRQNDLHLAFGVTCHFGK